MKTYTLVLSILLATALSGCATPPYFLSEIYDRNDSCQLRNNNGNYPSHCGAGKANAKVTRDYNTNKPLFYTK